MLGSVRRCLLCLAVFGLTSFGSVQATAQTAADPVAAEELFEAGRAAMDRKDYAVACQRFAESQRLDPAPGTLVNLAECLDRQGLVASSWQRWKEALDSLRPGDSREAAVKQRIAAAQARLPKLELRLAENAAPGAVVTRDGLVLGNASLGLELPVDPGPHRVVVTAPGHAPREYALTIAEKESQTLTVDAGPTESAKSTPAPSKSRMVLPTGDTSPSAGSGGKRTYGIVALSAGGAGLIVGGVAGALALSKKSTVNDECSRTNGTLLCDSQRGVDAAHAGRTFATIANVGVAVGVVGVGLGAYLLLTGDGASQTAVSARATPAGGGIDVVHSF